MATIKPKTRKTKVCNGLDSFILKCNGEKTLEKFYISRSKFSDGKTAYCKECAQKIFEYYYEKYGGDIQPATYYTCQKIDVPFITEIYEQVLDIYNSKELDNKEFLNLSKNYFGKYMNILNNPRVKKYDNYLDFTYSDSELSEVDGTIKRDAKQKKDLEKFKLDWGEQESVQDYLFLQDRFEEYTKGVNFSNAFHKDLYRDLCRDRLLLRKISENRYDKEDISKIQKRVSDVSTQLKVNEFEANKPKTPSQLALFEKIKLVDENNVNDIYENPTINYDINQIEKYEKDCVLRPTLKALINHRDYDLKLEDLKQYDIR